MSLSVLEKLKTNGERITPFRTALIKILDKSHSPQTPAELLAILSKRGFAVNKTTIYRQLQALEDYNVIRAVHFTDRSIRYEMVNSSGHHHHLVCLECKRIEDVSFPTDLKIQEDIIRKKHHFKVLQHSLEFFGLCKKCQKA